MKKEDLNKIMEKGIKGSMEKQLKVFNKNALTRFYLKLAVFLGKIGKM